MTQLPPIDPPCEDSPYRRFLVGGSFVLGGRIATALLALVTNALLARLLLPQDLGIYFIASSLVLFGSVAGSFGLQETAVRFIAESLSLQQWERVRKTIRLVFRIDVATALCAGITFFLSGELLANRLFEMPQLAALSLAIAVWITVSTVQGLVAESFRGFNDIGLATLFGNQVVGGLLTRLLFALSVAFLWWSKEPAGLPVILWIVVGASCASLVPGGWMLRRRVESLNSNPASASAGDLGYQDVMRVAVPVLITYVTLFFMTQVDLWVMGAFRQAEEVAVYGAASRLAQLVGVPAFVTNSVVPPIIASLYAQGKKKELEHTLRKVAALASIPSLLLTVLFLIFKHPVMVLVYGTFYQAGGAVLVLLCLGQAVNVFTGSCAFALTMTGHQTTMMVRAVLLGLAAVAG
ncbi:MAG: oligosaccharide flippase family protein, partial [Acidobacteria bacterium]|nr:oligosaccharide flippase family protein [Acidobacteriota bacterium]